MEKTSKIYIAGHRGMAGSALMRELAAQGYTNVLGRTRSELDLERQADVEAFFATEKPDYVFLAAALVGGLFENVRRPAEFLMRNLRITTNIIDAAYQNGAKKLMFLGSSCTYPLITDRLLTEDDLGTGRPEPTNEGYAIAKLAGTKLCDFYRKQYNFDALTIMPPNLMGPNDDFDPKTAHVVQGMMVRMHAAKLSGDKEFTVWGSGTPRREYMHADDFAAAAIHLMNQPSEHSVYNVGTSEDHSILELATMIKQMVGFDGAIVTDPSKPDGAPRKTMDSSRLLGLGWKPKITLDEAIRRTYQEYLQTI